MLALFLLLLIARVPSLAGATCVASTCMNGGTCDDTYNGKGFRCKCPESISEYGPRCEIGSRSYWTSPFGFKYSYVVTTHDLSSHLFETGQLVITFELMAHCVRPPCNIVEVKGRASNRALVTIQLDTKTNQYRLWTPASGDHTDASKARAVPSAPNVAPGWAGFWQSMTIHMRKNNQKQLLMTRIQLCSLTEYQCFDDDFTTKYDGDLQEAFKLSAVTLGRNMKGCIRFFRVNGAIVDLSNRNMLSLEGTATWTSEYCYYHDAACTRRHLGDSSRICGSDSQCNGVLLVNQGNGIGGNCTCRCVNGKRRERETITNNERCLISASWNECTVETPIINTGAEDYSISWTMQDSGPIGVGVNFFSVEAMLKTSEKDAPKVLTFASTGADELYARILNGLLDFCIGPACYPFPNVAVADGEWHSVSASIRKRELIVLVDKLTKLYTLDTAFHFRGATVLLSIPNSCVRSIRLSNIYLPTSGSDATADSEAQYIRAALKPHGAAAGPTCEVASQWGAPGGGSRSTKSCGCPELEDCDRSSGGPPKCICKAGLTRNVQGKCVIGEELLKMLEPSRGQSVCAGAEVILLGLLLQAPCLIHFLSANYLRAH